MRWDESVKHTDTGDIPFHYTQLGTLRRELRPTGLPTLPLDSMSKIFSVGKEYDTDIITLFHACGDFQHRDKWQDGVADVEVVNHYLPRVGMKCRCSIMGEQATIYSGSFRFQEDRIEFTEADERGRFLTRFTLERMPVTAPAPRTRLTVDYHVHKEIASALRFKLFRKSSIEKRYLRSLENLAQFVSEFKIPNPAPDERSLTLWGPL